MIVSPVKALLNVTRLSCSIFFPLEMMFLSEAFGATKRIEQFLLLEERDEKQPVTSNNNKDDQLFPATGSGTENSVGIFNQIFALS